MISEVGENIQLIDNLEATRDFTTTFASIVGVYEVEDLENVFRRRGRNSSNCKCIQNMGHRQREAIVQRHVQIFVWLYQFVSRFFEDSRCLCVPASMSKPTAVLRCAVIRDERHVSGNVSGRNPPSLTKVPT